jgi:hypothetical protein
MKDMQKPHGTENKLNYKYRLTTAPPLQGCFGSNPPRPIHVVNPYTYTHRSIYKNKQFLKHKQNRRYKERKFKLTYEQQQERDRNPERKEHKRSVETGKHKGKRKIDMRKSTPMIQIDPQNTSGPPFKKALL